MRSFTLNFWNGKKHTAKAIGLADNEPQYRAAGPVISKVDLGGLLSSPQQSGSISFSSNPRAATPQQQASCRVAAKMIEVNDLWQDPLP